MSINHMGSHWTAVWIGKDNATEHFCSYGMSAPVALHWALGGKYKRSYVQLQNLGSELCGYYCMLYLMCKCRGFSMEEFLNCFTDDQKVNEDIIRLVWNAVL